MPRNLIGPAPFPVQTVDIDVPLSLRDVRSAFEQSGTGAVSLCVRSAIGPEARGGYFFHFERVDRQFRLRTFDNNVIATLDADALVRFINHVTGRQFDAEMLAFCQTTVNFRLDQTADEAVA